jgi:adenine phosphoribosyltransferase
MHADAVKKGDKVLIVDDLLATGGTIGAAVELISSLGAEVVGCAFVVELTELKGREKLPGIDVFALTQYPY